MWAMRAMARQCRQLSSESSAYETLDVLACVTNFLRVLAPLQQRTRLGERQPRETRMQRAWITVPEVAEEIRLHVPFREELLISHRFIRNGPRLPLRVRARFAEECVQRRIVDCAPHAACLRLVLQGQRA